MIKILCTGGAGYLGSVLIPELLKKDYKVTILDNFLYGQSSLLNCCFDENLEVIRGDVRNIQKYVDVWDYDFILPLAAIVGYPACNINPDVATSVNYEAVKKLMNICTNEQKVIFPCTNSGYGVGEKDVFCFEETPLRPISLYGGTKVQAEFEVMKHSNSISLRLATVFGLSPRMRLDLLVNDLVYRAITDGCVVLYEAKFKRNYVHIRDVANAFIHCIENFDKLKNNVYNVGLSSCNLSKWELCEEIKKQVPNFYFVEANVGKDPDQRNYIVSNEKFEKTGWKAQVSLQQGITELIKGYQIIRRNQYSNV